MHFNIKLISSIEFGLYINMPKSSECVKVMVRVRPMNKKEIGLGNCLNIAI